ncbi:MAG: aspartate/glutamate racemase family protein [Actinomycetaceae bacterium]|nr:aspartate/glutamate racemase family protein [Actinomycetaceae bacterium]
MRILVVNVNTTATMTQSIADAAKAVANKKTEIVELTPFIGADSVEGNYESYLSAVAVMDRVLAYEDHYDAVIQAGFGEHGKEGLMEICDVPVIDITEAAAHTAMLLGYRFSVVTTLDRACPLIEERLLLAGLHQHCASVRASGLSVLELEEDPSLVSQAIAQEAKKAVEEDKAEVIVLGCGGMAGLDKKIAEVTHAPVVDGVSCAVKLAESMVTLGLRTSKVRTYAPPRPKNVQYWPLHRHIFSSNTLKGDN